jgi:hypothetical protein
MMMKTAEMMKAMKMTKTSWKNERGTVWTNLIFKHIGVELGYKSKKNSESIDDLKELCSIRPCD